MQTKRDNSQAQFELMPSLEEQIPEDYPLRRLNRVLDLSFVHERVRSLYCQDNGRPSIDPEVLVRLFLLQAITDTPSVRELLREAGLHLGWRWFIGYGATEPLPDHSTLSRALSRFGDELFNEIFTRSISQCRDSGLIEGRILHLDATTIRADLDKDMTGNSGASDPDARFGRFPDGGKEPGYKQQTVVDDASRVIVAMEVLAANAAEGSAIAGVLEDAIEQAGTPEAICADSAYASGANASLCDAAGIQLVSPPRVPRNHHSDTQFGVEEFVYDERLDVFRCPAGKVLTKKGGCGRPGRWKYQASARDCGRCPLKVQCTKAPGRCINVGSHHGALVRLREASKTEHFRQLYRRRSPVIEGVFAEAKDNHGLRRAWRRGLTKMRIQCLVIATVLNLKRLAKGRYGPDFTSKPLTWLVLELIWPLPGLRLGHACRPQKPPPRKMALLLPIRYASSACCP